MGLIFQGADLRGANLSDADLSDANLSDANLRDAIYNIKTIFPDFRNNMIYKD